MLQRERRKAYSGAYLLRVMRVLHNDAKLVVQKLWEFRSMIVHFNRSLCSGVVQSIGKILDLIDDSESQFNRPIVLRLNTPINSSIDKQVGIRLRNLLKREVSEH